MDTGAPCPGHNLDFSNGGAMGHTEKSTCAKYEVISCDICGLTDMAHATYRLYPPYMFYIFKHHITGEAGPADM